MPPKIKRGIVKSGNAGNSSKASKITDATPSGTNQDNEKPLFPVGSKYPASLLHERCLKEGWDKPQIDTFKHANDGWSFAVTLSRFNKKKSEREFVRFTPHPQYYRASAVEARHWGATYALYRFSNGLPLHLMLPKGPRDYWKELEIAHKAAPEHQQWMYAADPFAAAQQVKDRQAKVAAKGDDTTSQAKQNHVSGPYTHCPEVKMATTLREEVESAISEGFRLYSTDDASALTGGVLDVVSRQLEIMGFQRSQIQKTTLFLSQPSPLLSKFLESSAPLEAAIEHLLLNTPECDLPSRFMPENNTSNPFISSAHAGTSSVKKRWVESRAVKEAGWPIHVVQEFTANTALLDNWPQLIANLGKRLLGFQNLVEESITTPFEFDEEEILALGAELKEPGEYILPSFTAPLVVHILFDHAQHLPRQDCTPIFISSNTVSSYVRLHILSRILSAFYHTSTFDEPVDSFGITIMRIVDEEWALIEDNGPPDMASVMIHLFPRSKEQPDNTRNDLQVKKTENKPTKHHRSTNVRSPFIKQNVKISTAIINTRNKLPAHQMRSEFLSTLQTNRVVVVVGETGSGKTTQLPQYILESFEETECGDPYIIITQPRRISAISVAKRVSEERGNDGTVSYAVRGQSNQGSNTRLLFCTTGIVLRRLGNGDKLNDVTHVVVDEVHERSLDGDFLLLALKQLLVTHPRLKVVLMSATINYEVFAQYFRGAPVLSISGRTYPVTDKYLEDIIPDIDYSPVSLERHQGVSDSKVEKLRQRYGNQLTDKALLSLDVIETSKCLDYQLIGKLITHIMKNQQRAGILIFLPGVNEIRQCIETMKSRLDLSLADVLPLHANLPIEEQNRVFEKTSKWKIIASTNVAETSITIDDIVYVIDSGRVKETRYVAESDLTLLEEVLVTRAAAKQRRGRAGRVQPGICYKIYSKRTETLMAEFPRPEILRVPLEQVTLTAKMMDEGHDVKALLREVIDPPDSNTVDRAWQSLQDLGAIDLQDGLTPLGRHMALLPLDVRLAKMLILGTVFHCLDPILTISALLSSKPLFLSPMEQKGEAARSRAKFFAGNSDLITDLEAFNQCRKLKKEKKVILATFCKENFISTTTLQEIFTLRREYCIVLEERGFLPLHCDMLDATMNMNSGNQNLLKGIILGGLWPRVARVHLPKSAIKFDKIQAGTIQRDNSAKEFKIYDLREGPVFIHPGSILFDCSSWRSPFLAYFNKYKSSKVFLRDATEMPMYALLLFGGSITVDHIKGGITIGSKEAYVRMKAVPRIGVLVNQLRQLLDLLLIHCIEDGSSLQATQTHPVVQAMLSVLIGDGMTQ